MKDESQPKRRGPGQPRIGTRRQVILDDATDELARRYGKDNERSAGLRELARIIRRAEDGPACVRRWLDRVRSEASQEPEDG